MNRVKQGKLTFILIDENWCCVAECEKDATAVEIPEKVEGRFVNAVSENAFEDCALLERVVFPQPSEGWCAFTEIGDYAFSDCQSLKELHLPEGVTHIGRGAFYGCRNLKTVTFSRAFVGSYAFSGCENLVSVTPVDYVSEGAFRGCKSLKELPVTKDLTEIEEDGFEHCEGLTEIVIPASVRVIGGLAFRSCYGLKKAVFEQTEGWTWHCSYTDEDAPLDLSDPERNAKNLASVDFDDGVAEWRRKE